MATQEQLFKKEVNSPQTIAVEPENRVAASPTALPHLKVIELKQFIRRCHREVNMQRACAAIAGVYLESGGMAA